MLTFYDDQYDLTWTKLTLYHVFESVLPFAFHIFKSYSTQLYKVDVITSFKFSLENVTKMYRFPSFPKANALA